MAVISVGMPEIIAAGFTGLLGAARAGVEDANGGPLTGPYAGGIGMTELTAAGFTGLVDAARAGVDSTLPR